MTEAIYPNLHNDLWKLLAGTSAEDRVSTQIPRAARYPRIVYGREGGVVNRLDQRIDQPRMRIDCFADEDEAAWDLFYEVKAILLPRENVVHGFRGKVGDTWIDDVVMNAGPSTLYDEATKKPLVSSYWIFTTT